MATAFFMLSSAAGADEQTVTPPFSNHLLPPVRAVPQVKPKARRASATKSTQPKRPPQRGLGVAQLERLRLQERWRNITDPAAAGGLAGVDINIFSHALTYGDNAGGDQWSCAPLGGGIVDVQSRASWDEHAMDRMRISGYTPAMIAPKLELPSNQMQQIASGGGGMVMPSPPPATSLQCVPDDCDFCIRKKRLLDEGHAFRGRYAAMNLMNLNHTTTLSGDQVNMNVRSGADNQILRQYYAFFPENSGAGNPRRSQTTFLGDDEKLPAPAPVDLTLKLSII